MPPRNRSRSGFRLGLGRTPHTPLDFRHHACVHDADARVFDALLRGLRQRLFDGCTRDEGGIRTAALRQGASPGWAQSLIVSGLLGILIAALAASELGRDLRQRSQDGGVFDAAVFFCLQAGRMRAWGGLAAAVLGSGLWARLSVRKDIWMMAVPAAEPGRIHLWLAGAASAHPARFAREFTAVVAQARAFVPAPAREGDRQSASR